VGQRSCSIASGCIPRSHAMSSPVCPAAASYVLPVWSVPPPPSADVAGSEVQATAGPRRPLAPMFTTSLLRTGGRRMRVAAAAPAAVGRGCRRGGTTSFTTALLPSGGRRLRVAAADTAVNGPGGCWWGAALFATSLLRNGGRRLRVAAAALAAVSRGCWRGAPPCSPPRWVGVADTRFVFQLLPRWQPVAAVGDSLVAAAV